MAADEAQQEPTMEEILASIRRIISEDDEGAPPANDADPVEAEEEVLDLSSLVEPEAEDVPEETVDELPEPEPVDEPDTFEIDDLVAVDEEPEPETEAPDMSFPEPEETFTPEPANEPEPSFPLSASETETLVETPAATYAATALSKLSGSLKVGTGATIDDVVAELLRPLLKEWLNENLPSIVEAKVEEEVKRISRMAR